MATPQWCALEWEGRRYLLRCAMAGGERSSLSVVLTDFECVWASATLGEKELLEELSTRNPLLECSLSKALSLLGDALCGPEVDSTSVSVVPDPPEDLRLAVTKLVAAACTFRFEIRCRVMPGGRREHACFVRDTLVLPMFAMCNALEAALVASGKTLTPETLLPDALARPQQFSLGVLCSGMYSKLTAGRLPSATNEVPQDAGSEPPTQQLDGSGSLPSLSQATAAGETDAEAERLRREEIERKLKEREEHPMSKKRKRSFV